VRALLDEAGILNGEDGTRGFDHGTFVPLMLTYPKAEVPAIQLSLKKGLDPGAAHRNRPRAAAAARRGHLHRGQRHDLSQPARHAASVRPGRIRSIRRVAARRDGEEPEARNTALVGWASAPGARQAHPGKNTCCR
jgi:hypothetical protein